MSRCYLDTSAALKLVIDEPESAALAAFLDEKQPELVACFLLETELRRAVHRVDGLSQQLVGMVLDGVASTSCRCRCSMRQVSCPDGTYGRWMLCTSTPPSASA